MKRIVFDVPRWHAYLHRDARCLDLAKEKDGPLTRIEDELFDRLYSGETERLPPRQQDQKLGGWADGVHQTCEQLPAFQRLAAECQGDAMAAGTAVETLVAELKLEVAAEQDPKPLENLRRSVGTGEVDPIVWTIFKAPTFAFRDSGLSVDRLAVELKW